MVIFRSKKKEVTNPSFEYRDEFYEKQAECDACGNFENTGFCFVESGVCCSKCGKEQFTMVTTVREHRRRLFVNPLSPPEHSEWEFVKHRKVTINDD